VHPSEFVTAVLREAWEGWRWCILQEVRFLFPSNISLNHESRMISGDKRAVTVFKEDVERTYAHVVNRVKINKEEQSGQREQIQLVAENPETTIGFNVPEGPPPENLVLEGPGTEDLDIEEVRKALQFRWDVFEGYSDDLKEALTKGELDGVNKVLGEMDVPAAEAVVQSLDAAGILSFAGGGIRDETGKAGEEGGVAQ